MSTVKLYVLSISLLALLAFVGLATSPHLAVSGYQQTRSFSTAASVAQDLSGLARGAAQAPAILSGSLPGFSAPSSSATVTGGQTPGYY